MSYITAVLMFGAIWAFLYTGYPHLRTSLWASGCLFLPAGFSEALFVPVYWTPEVIWRYGRIDIESLLFAFFTGGVASVLYPAFFRYRIVPAAEPLTGFRMHLFWIFPTLGGIILVGVSKFTELSVIHTAFAIFLAGTFHMLMVRPDLFNAWIWGASLFLLTYSGVLAISIRLFGESFLGAWRTEPLFGIHLFRLPIDEFLYAFLFGGLWSTVYCGIFNRRFIKAEKRKTGRVRS